MKRLALLIVLGAPVSLTAQAPSPAPPAGAAVPALAPTALSIPVGSRVGDLPSGYDEGGRRDPFTSLVVSRRATTSPTPGGRPRTGLASLALADVTVRGITRSGKTMFAILEGPNKQSYVARANDRLMDGSVQSIDVDGVLFHEQIDGGTPNQVRKTLRPAGEEVR
jgi:hypothetical protein